MNRTCTCGIYSPGKKFLRGPVLSSSFFLIFFELRKIKRNLRHPKSHFSCIKNQWPLFFLSFLFYFIALNLQSYNIPKGEKISSMEVTNKYITIKAHINGAPHESDFELKTETLPISVEPGSNDVVVKSLYLSIDPYQINRMKSSSPSQNTSSFAVAIVPGEVSQICQKTCLLCCLGSFFLKKKNQLKVVCLLNCLGSFFFFLTVLGHIF